MEMPRMPDRHREEDSRSPAVEVFGWVASALASASPCTSRGLPCWSTGSSAPKAARPGLSPVPMPDGRPDTAADLGAEAEVEHGASRWISQRVRAAVCKTWCREAGSGYTRLPKPRIQTKLPR